MTKPFDTLYADLDKALNLGDRNRQATGKYLHGIELIRGKIDKLRSLQAKFIRNEATEKTFFREVWPAFHAKLFLYIWLHGAELRRDQTPADGWAGVISEEENRVAAFFGSNLEFWQYYRAGGPVLDEQFTRAYSRGRIFDPLALVVDQEAATLASYRAALCLAMFSYGEWLREERALLSAGAVSAADLGYSWTGTDADLVEWLSGLHATGAIQYKGQAADLSRMNKWGRLAVGREVSNIWDRSKVLRNRKKERLPFTRKMAAALEKKWNQAEGKFE